jgi:hypothetical protein
MSFLYWFIAGTLFGVVLGAGAVILSVMRRDLVLRRWFEQDRLVNQRIGNASWTRRSDGPPEVAA